MKTKKFLIALTVILFTSFNLVAAATSDMGINLPDSGKNRINIRVNSDNQVVLRAACCDNEKRINLVLKVYSERGNLVYATSMHKKGGVYKAFDMSKLPQGKYNFVVQKNMKDIYQKEVFKSTEFVSSGYDNGKMLVQEL